MRTITTQPRQSIFDIALQHLGSPEAAFIVAEKIGCSITDELIAGTQVVFTESEIMDRRVADFFRQNNITPATEAVENLSAIGNMRIEYSFIVE